MILYQLLETIFFIFILEAISFAFLPLVTLIFPMSYGYSFTLSRIFGLLLLASILWILVYIKILNSGIYCILLVLIAAFLLAKYFNKKYFNYLIAEDYILFLSFYLVFAFFLFIRFLHPEIHWGEKPMDFTFLNYFLRLDTLPPQEPWAAGIQMHYYYGGFFLYSNLLKLSAISGDLGYNLLVSLVPALYFTGLCLIFRVLTIDAKSSVTYSSLIALSSNPEILIRVFAGKNIDSHLFWASTRVYPSPSFTEYPFWTFLFADLHPHFMALPFVCIFLFLAIYGFKQNYSFIIKILLSLNLAFLVLCNAWDAISCSIFLALLWLVYASMNLNFAKFVVESLYFLISISILAVPTFLTIRTKSNHGILWAIQSEFNDIDNIFRIFGFWMTLSFVVLLISMRTRIYMSNLIYFIFSALICATIVASSMHFVGALLPWDIVMFFMILALMQVFSRDSEQLIWPIILTFGLFIAVVFIAVEHIVFIDRMNSYFKFHYFLWTCFGVYSLSLVHLQKNKYIINFLCAPICFLGLAASAYSLWIDIVPGFHWNLTGVSKELNGFNYYKNFNYYDFQVIEWLRKNSNIKTVIAEAHGPSYQNYTRISANTGIPTVLGWDYHVSQRGVSQMQIKKRKDALNLLYESSDIVKTCEALKEFNVQFVIVGQEERNEYKIPENKFPDNVNCLKPVFSNGKNFILEFLPPNS